MEKQNPNSQESSLDNLEELSGLNPEAMDLVNTFTSLFGMGAGMRIRKMLLESPEFLATLKSKSIDYNSYDSMSSFENDYSDRNYEDDDSDVESMTNVYKIYPLIKEVAADYEFVHARVLARLRHYESGGQVDAENDESGAAGLTQITSVALNDYCKREKVDPKSVDLNDSRTNLTVTCSNLNHYLNRDKVQNYLRV